jgi:hypothetical protein
MHTDDAQLLLDEEVDDIIKKSDGEDASSLKRLAYLTRAKEILAEHQGHKSTNITSFGACFACPKMTLRDFLVHGPFGEVLIGSVFTTSAKRAMLFSVNALGAVMLVTFFLEAGGPRARGAEQLAEECSSKRSFWEGFGRLLTIGIVSSMIGRAPAWFLASLSSREFKQVGRWGGAAWQKQLRVWRCRDRIFWLFGVLYVAFCAHFVVLFFANVSLDDQWEWITSAAIQWAKDLFVLPLLFSCVLPVATLVMVCMLTFCLKKQDLTEETSSGDLTHEASQRGSGLGRGLDSDSDLEIAAPKHRSAFGGGVFDLGGLFCCAHQDGTASRYSSGTGERSTPMEVDLITCVMPWLGLCQGAAAEPHQEHKTSHAQAQDSTTISVVLAAPFCASPFTRVAMRRFTPGSWSL